MKKYTLLVVLVLVTIFGVWALWTQTRPTDDSFPEQVNKPEIEDIGVVLEPNADQIQDGENPPLDDGPSSKRIVHVPDNRQDSKPSSPDIDPEFRQSVKAKIETALDGNIEDLFTIVRYLNDCHHVSEDEFSLTTFFTANANRLRDHFSIPDGLGKSRKKVSLEEWEAYHWQRFYQCHSIKGLFEDDFRDRIINKAESGHVVARYIYAMWPPPSRQSSLFVREEILEYEILALEFTWLNINAGEPLGLLALGQSYVEMSLFTPARSFIGLAYFIAAKKCGISSAQVDSTIDNAFIHYYEKAQADSDEIVETFCN